MHSHVERKHAYADCAVNARFYEWSCQLPGAKVGADFIEKTSSTANGARTIPSIHPESDGEPILDCDEWTGSLVERDRNRRRAALANGDAMIGSRFVAVRIEIRKHAVAISLKLGDRRNRMLAGRCPPIERFEVSRLVELATLFGGDDLPIEEVGDLREMQ